MKIIKIIVYSILSLIIIFFGGRILLNLITINLYNNDNYNDNLLKPLYILNINEPYIVYYNNGNINYQKKEFDNAIDNYIDSLDHNPPKDKICEIRVNLSLAMVSNITTSNKKTILKELKEARKVLYEDDCAFKNSNNGESEKAEQLEEEIKKLEEQVSESEGNDDSDDQNDSKDENDKTEDVDENIQQQIEKNRKNAISARQEDITRSELFDDYEPYHGKNW